MKNHKKNALLLLVLLVIAVATAMAALRGQDKGRTSAKEEEPTLIREGVMTKKQKEHSKIFKGYDWFTDGKKLKDSVEERGDVAIRAPIRSMPYLPPVALGEYLSKTTCEADAVVIGRVESKSSNLIESGTFLFTDYEITAEEILKNNAASPILPGSNITVTRSGGAVVLNKHIVRAIDPYIAPLLVGQHYLLYLRFIPATGAYGPFADLTSEDTFRIQGEKISQVSRKQWPIGWHGQINAGAFITEVRSALNTPCSGGGHNDHFSF